MKIRELMRTEVQTVAPDTPVTDVLRLWRDKGDRGVVVVAQGHVEGIITEGDLVARRTPLKPVRFFTFLDAIIPLGEVGRSGMRDLQRHVGTRASDIMTSPVITVAADSDLSEAAQVFVEHRIRHLPVIDDQGRLVGMLSRSDVLVHASENLV